MFERVKLRLHIWHMRNLTRRKLHMLDNRILTDLGIERDSIDTFVDQLPPDQP